MTLCGSEAGVTVEELLASSQLCFKCGGTSPISSKPVCWFRSKLGDCNVVQSLSSQVDQRMAGFGSVLFSCLDFLF